MNDIPSEWQYVAAAYLVVFVTVLLWVAIIGAKLQRLQRQVGELVGLASRERSGVGSTEPVEREAGGVAAGEAQHG